MKITDEMIRRLQKDGDFHFQGLTRDESRNLAARLAQAAMNNDQQYGVESNFGVARDGFGYYYATVIL